jgi:catechol 2,3-dioxygenase-like lactoylglutathione lyase family enzyme
MLGVVPEPEEGQSPRCCLIALVERSRRFYTEVLGGETVLEGEPPFVALANSWIIINVGGGPTDDKPTVTLETPLDPDRGAEIRCYLRDPDGHLIEVGQTSEAFLSQHTL